MSDVNSWDQLEIDFYLSQVHQQHTVAVYLMTAGFNRCPVLMVLVGFFFSFSNWSFPFSNSSEMGHPCFVSRVCLLKGM